MSTSIQSELNALYQSHLL